MNKPITPADVQMQKSVTGEIIAFDTRNKVILASGFDDESDFKQWLKLRFDQ